VSTQNKKITIQSLWEKLPSYLQNLDPKIFKSNNYVFVDFETTNIDKGSPYNSENSLVLAVWEYGEDHPDYDGGASHYCWGSEYQQEVLANACEKAEFVVAHNAKFELGWLKRCGINTSNVLLYCTQIGEYVRAGNRKRKLSLDASLERYGLASKIGTVSKLIGGGICPSQIPPRWLLKYGLQDVKQGHRLFKLQRELLDNRGLLPTQFTRCIFTNVLEDLERTGMHLDKERVETVIKKYNSDLFKLQQQMDKITGGINTKSVDQKAEFLYKILKFPIPKDFRGNEIRGKKKNEAWPEGVPTTKSDYVKKLPTKTKKQREFLDILSKLNKVKDAKSKFLDKFLACVTETNDQILYATFNQTLTQTHRLSSSGKQYKAQFQNFARIFKPLFSARNEGWSFGEADEAQLEYRIAVFLAGDVAGKYDIEHGVDSHGYTASIIFKEEWSKCGGDKNTAVGYAVRTDSKEHTFKPLYGGKSGTDRQKEYYKAFQDKHKQITETQENWKKEVYQTRELTTITGLKFYWRDAKMNRKGTLIRPDGRPVDQSVCNTPVQSFATADIVPIAVTLQWYLMKVAEMESFLVSTVHDSSLGEIHPDEGELYEEIAVYSMVDGVYKYLEKVYDITLDVPLECEVDIGTHWAESEEWRKEYLNV